MTALSVARARWSTFGLCLALAACGVSGEAPSGRANVDASRSIEASVRPSPASTPDPTETPQPSAEPSEEARPTPFFPPASVTPVTLPDGLDQFAWATVVGVSFDELGNTTTFRLFAGHLGSAFSHDEVVQYDRPITNRLDLEVVVDRDVVALVTEGREETRIDVRRIDGWAHIVSIELDSWVIWQDIRLDARREVVYAAVPNVDGGLDIMRFGFDGSVTRLLSFDARFIPELAAPDVATFAIDAEGVLLIEACETSTCRLWTVPPSATSAGDPIAIAGTAGVCRAVGATSSWLVISDSVVCSTDSLPAPLPYRAISRVDGTSHVITSELAGVQNVVGVDGRVKAIGATWCHQGSTWDVVAIDIDSGAQESVFAGLPCLEGDPSLRVSRQGLPGSWVMLTPVRAYDTAPSDAVLLNLESGERIDLPFGTFGYGG